MGGGAVGLQRSSKFFSSEHHIHKLILASRNALRVFDLNSQLPINLTSWLVTFISTLTPFSNMPHIATCTTVVNGRAATSL